MIVISDTSYIGYLIIIDKLFLLKDNFSEIIIPQKVHNEILQLPAKYNLHKYLNSDWINISTIVNSKLYNDELISNTTFKINNILYQNALKQANEL